MTISNKYGTTMGRISVNGSSHVSVSDAPITARQHKNPHNTHPVNFEHYQLDESIVSMRHDPAGNALYALGSYSLFRKLAGEGSFTQLPILTPDNKELEMCRSFAVTSRNALCVTVYSYRTKEVSKMYVQTAGSSFRPETRFGGFITEMPNQEHNISTDGNGRVFLLDVPTGNVIWTDDFHSYHVDEYLTGSYKLVLQTGPKYDVQSIKVNAQVDSDLHHSAFIGTTANAIVIHSGKPKPAFPIGTHAITSTVNYAWDETNGRLFSYFNFPGATTQDIKWISACEVTLADGSITRLSGYTPPQYPLLYPDTINNFGSRPIATASRDHNGNPTDQCFYVLAKQEYKHVVVLETPDNGYVTNIPPMQISSLYQYNGMLYVGTNDGILAYKETDLFASAPMV